MIEVNKTKDTAPNVRCYKCKAEFYVHELANMNAPYITDCKLHNSKCEHEWESEFEPLPIASTDPNLHVTNNLIKCKKCEEFYR